MHLFTVFTTFLVMATHGVTSQVIVLPVFEPTSTSDWFKVGTTAAPIHTLEGGSFNDCDNFTEASLPPTLNKVGEYVFTNCDRLNKVTMPASLLAIDVIDCAA